MLDLEGQPFFFPAIYKKVRDDKNLEDGELEDSNTSQEQLEILGGEWLKNRKQKPDNSNNGPVVDSEMQKKMQDFLTKLQGNEELELSKYYDVTDGPLATSGKTKDKKAKEVDSDD